MSQKSIRSPFLIYEEALSPLQCERLVDDANFLMPDIDKDSQPIMTSKHTPLAHTIVTEFLESHKAEIEEFYTATIAGIEPTRICWSNSTVAPKPVCDNSSRIKNSWLRVHNRDVTVMVFLSDYNDKPPFDGDFEVYGGKMEFPTYQFGFNPTRGTMIIYPSDPHFTHIFSKVELGNLYLSKTFVYFNEPLLYQPSNFPGTYIDWLKDKF